jgi:hypothetical protein
MYTTGVQWLFSVHWRIVEEWLKNHWRFVENRQGLKERPFVFDTFWQGKVKTSISFDGIWPLLSIFDRFLTQDIKFLSKVEVKMNDSLSKLDGFWHLKESCCKFLPTFTPASAQKLAAKNGRGATPRPTIIVRGATPRFATMTLQRYDIYFKNRRICMMKFRTTRKIGCLFR